jgi:hypothetical protein
MYLHNAAWRKQCPEAQGKKSKVRKKIIEQLMEGIHYFPVKTSKDFGNVLYFLKYMV